MHLDDANEKTAAPGADGRSVERDGERGALELIAKLTATLGQRDRGRESVELQGDAVDVEAFEVEERSRVLRGGPKRLMLSAGPLRRA